MRTADWVCSSVPAKPQRYFCKSQQSPVWRDNGRGVQLAHSQHPVGLANVVMHVGTTAGRDGTVYRGEEWQYWFPTGGDWNKASGKEAFVALGNLGQTATHTAFCTLAFRVPEGLEISEETRARYCCVHQPCEVTLSWLFTITRGPIPHRGQKPHHLPGLGSPRCDFLHMAFFTFQAERLL